MSDRLAEVRGRVERATPGPWAWDSRGDNCLDVQVGIALDRNDKQVGGFIVEGQDVTCIGGVAEMTDSNHHANAAFIAHSREDVPWLLAEVERLQVALAGQEASREQAATD